MSDFPDIIDTKIISSEWDAFWQQPDMPNMREADVLVISQPYTAAGKEEAQLMKMLQACTLSEEQYNILQLAPEQKAAWHMLREQLKPKVMLLLGISLQQLGISVMLPFLSPGRFNDCLWVAAPALPDLEQQPETKKQLWLNGLKPVFVDKTIAGY